MALYSDVVMDHFKNPRNIGKPKKWDAVGQVGNPTCGDVMYIYIKVDDNIISDIGFETMGCAAAIATTSMLTDLAKGKTLEEAEKITKDDVAAALEGLPQIKMHCSNLAADGLRAAIQAFREGKEEVSYEKEGKCH